jgi:hypothetical protein
MKIKNREVREVFNLEKPVGDMKEIEVAVSFTAGGMNYFSGQSHSKGYRVVCSPCNITKREDGTEIRSSVLLSGKRDSGLAYRICDTARYSEKRLNEIAVQVDFTSIAKWYGEENDTAIQQHLATIK